LSTHSSTSKNVTWPHFSWPTLYTYVVICLNWRHQMPVAACSAILLVVQRGIAHKYTTDSDRYH